jgi:protein-disulfide isomerase
MKKFFSKNYTLSSLVLVVLVFIACQKSVESKPNYIFKPAPSAEAVAKVNGEIVSAKDFYTGIEGDLYEAEMKVYEIKYTRLQSLIMEKLIAQDPNKKNLSNEQFVEQYITKDVKVSDAQVEKFIKDRQIPKDQVTAEIKGRIVEYLTVEEKKNSMDKWIAEKTKKSPVEVYFAKPTLPVFDVQAGDAPSKGGQDAKVTIIEFSDFQCPFCSKGATILSEIEKKYGNKVKIAFKNFPLPFHAQAKGAANAGLCANEQGSKFFWKMHDAMFADQTKLDVANLKATGKKIGLKEADFNACVDSGKYNAKVEADMAEGQKVGIKSTPTFFVNGKLLMGAQPIENFSEIIDEELAK